MYKGAIIGLGNVALGGHLPAWGKSSGFRIVAGVDSMESRLDLFGRALPGAARITSVADLPEDLDFVDICTPPHTHFDLALFALERGWNVLCEKPLVLSEEQFDRIRQLSVNKERVLFTVHNWRFAPICRKITEVVRGGVLGDIRHCVWNVVRTGPSVTIGTGNWRLDPRRAGGGILVDHGWHAFYLVSEWVGRRPIGVQASLENRQYPEWEVEDTALIKVEFESVNGHSRAADIFLTWASNDRFNGGVVSGTLGRLDMEDDTLRLDIRDGGREVFHFDSRLSAGSHHPDWFEFVIEEFGSELRDASCRGANLNVVHQCLRLVERSRAASQSKAYLAL
jgi:predicted dehydrogenase